MHEFSLEWFSYLQPTINKILKDDRGQMIIKDFLKFLKIMHELDRNRQTRFVHFFAYFNRLVSLVEVVRGGIFPKGRSILHYICLYGHVHILQDVTNCLPSSDCNQLDDDHTVPLHLALKNKHTSLIRFLLRQPLSLEHYSLKYGYPLHLGLKNHEFKVVMDMIKRV